MQNTNKIGRFMVALGAVIEAPDREILILKRANNYDWQEGEWEIPYGRMHQFEEPLESLKREIKEETGITQLEIEKPFSVWHIFRGKEKTAEKELVGITFSAKVKNKKVVLSSEHSEYKWVKPKEALELIKVPGIKRDVEKFMLLPVFFGCPEAT